jgi:hypothetical protein
MPNEMENLLKELPRDPEIVALFKRISDEKPHRHTLSQA